MRREIEGFTLVELMVTLAVAAILAALAVPGGMAMIRNAQVSAAANDLMGMALRARSEALTRQALVTLCPFTGAAGCDPHATLSQGRAIFAGDIAPEMVLQQVPQIASNLQLTGDQVISFNARGFALQPVSIGLQRGNDDRFRRRLCVDLPGRVEIIDQDVCPHEAA